MYFFLLGYSQVDEVLLRSSVSVLALQASATP